jgi:UDP-3-O-[3-hydroxymyristoyl] glucosamine N-acyltransferase
MDPFVRPLTEALTVAALCARVPLGVSIAGNATRIVRGIAALGPGSRDALSFCESASAGERIAASASAVVVVPPGVDARPAAGQTLLVVDDPRAWFIAAVDALLPGAARPDDPDIGVDATARVGPDAHVARGAAIGASVVIGARTRIAAGAVVYAGCEIGTDCHVGPGTVIGGVGLAYHEAADGRRLFFPHLASVRIGDGVDVGANCCICRGMLSDTVVGDFVTIGSAVYVGHGVTLGERAWVSAASAIAGHACVGRRALLGIGAIVVDNVAIAAETLVGAGCVVTRDTRSGGKLVGVPGRDVPSLRRFGPTPR